MNRRKFIRNVGIATGAAFVLPRFSIAKSKSPNNKINVACVGVGGIGSMTFDGMRAGEGEYNIVAICDVDTKYSMYNRKRFAPDTPFFEDYRVMFDRLGKDIDAVCVSTPDHSHFKITLDAMQLGKHVACQKPLAHNVWQVRELARAKKYYKVQTQMMNQGHATEQIRMLKEWYDSGVLGNVREVHVLSTGPNWESVYFQKPEKFPMPKDEIPSNFNFDLWLNQASSRNFSKLYHPLKWRSFWDFGTGMLGDWFCHTGDAPVWLLDLKDPEYIELLHRDNPFDNSVVIPSSTVVKWHFPATDKRCAVDMYWYDGKKIPDESKKPKDWDTDRPWAFKNGAMLMVGDKHTMETAERPNFSPRMSNSAFFKDFKRNLPAKTIPRVRKGNLYLEWFDAIRGDIKECGSNFDYASQLTEVALLGCLAQRFGGRINWDAKNMRSTNRPELAQFIKEPERAGWESKSF